MRVDVNVVLGAVAVLGAAAAQDLVPATRLVPVKWPFLTAVALYYALTKPVLAAAAAGVWAGMLTDALGGLPQGGTCLLLALLYVAARLVRKVFGEEAAVQGVALMGVAGAVQQVWMRAWAGGSGVAALSLEMAVLAAAGAAAGLAAGGLVFLAMGLLDATVNSGRVGIRN